MDSSIPGWKPGLYYGADEQCKIAFGSVATACTFADSNVVGRKFVSLARGSREMFWSQDSAKGSWGHFYYKGMEGAFLPQISWQRTNLQRLLKCFTSLHHLLRPHKSPLRFAQYAQPSVQTGLVVLVLGTPTQGPVLGSSCSLDSFSFPTIAQVPVSEKCSIANSCHLDMFC